MDRFQKWLSAGLLALTPGIATAGALDSPQLKLTAGPRPAASAARAAKKTRAANNQELADQSAPVLPRSPAAPGFVRLADYQVENSSPASIQFLAAKNIVSEGTVARGAMGPAEPAGPAAYGPPMGTASPGIYNQANLPNYAFPTYAECPSYSTVSYPSQYSASAWPYMGPFHPYPQAPLGWRKITLQWDAGLWTLDFGTSRNRWWTNPY